MGDNETVGVATILVGVLIVIGAVRGTWKKLFQDVVLGQGQAPLAPTSLAFVNVPVSQGTAGQPSTVAPLNTSTFQQQTAPSPFVASF